MRKGQAVAGTAAFLILILLGLLAVTVLTGRIEQETPEASAGYADLSGFDFLTKLAYIPHSDFLYYREALYTPEDFLSGRVKPETGNFGTGVTGRFDPGRFGTYRIVLKLPDNMTYGLSSYSAMYSQCLFINGTEYPAFGVTGKTPDTTVPQTKHYTVYFTPDAGKAEIHPVFQFSSRRTLAGSSRSCRDTGQNRPARCAGPVADPPACGCALTAFYVFLGMFLFFHRRYAFVWFALACLAIAVRMLMCGREGHYAHVSEPALAAFHRAGVPVADSFCCWPSCCTSTICFRTRCLSGYYGLTGRWCALYASAVLLTPPVVYTRFNVWISGRHRGVRRFCRCGALFQCGAQNKDNRHPEHALIFVGALVFIVLS